MTTSTLQPPDPNRDLLLERIVDVPPELVWRAWTTPVHITKWFTPKPWETPECEIDLRPGGRFYTVMRSPEGGLFRNEGCYLEIVENRKLVWTNAMEPGYRPKGSVTTEHCGDFLFTAVITLEPAGNGTKYTALVIHQDEAGRQQHEALGFHEGWGTALDQLVAYVKTL